VRFLQQDISISQTITIKINSPPCGGIFKIKPDHGFMLETLFNMSGVGWLDEAIRLSFEIFVWLSFLEILDFNSSLRSSSELSFFFPHFFPRLHQISLVF